MQVACFSKHGARRNTSLHAHATNAASAQVALSLVLRRHTWLSIRHAEPPKTHTESLAILGSHLHANTQEPRRCQPFEREMVVRAQSPQRRPWSRPLILTWISSVGFWKRLPQEAPLALQPALAPAHRAFLESRPCPLPMPTIARPEPWNQKLGPPWRNGYTIQEQHAQLLAENWLIMYRLLVIAMKRGILRVCSLAQIRSPSV